MAINTRLNEAELITYLLETLRCDKDPRPSVQHAYVTGSRIIVVNDAMYVKITTRGEAEEDRFTLLGAFTGKRDNTGALIKASDDFFDSAVSKINAVLAKEDQLKDIKKDFGVNISYVGIVTAILKKLGDSEQCGVKLRQYGDAMLVVSGYTEEFYIEFGIMELRI